MVSFFELLGLVIAVFFLGCLIAIVRRQFTEAAIQPKVLEVGALSLPVLVVMLAAWQHCERMSYGLIRFEAVVGILSLIAMQSMSATGWCAGMVEAVRDFREDRLSTRAKIVALAVAGSAFLLLSEVGELVLGFFDSFKLTWAEVPSSVKFFLYGLISAILGAVAVVLVGTWYNDKPELGKVLQNLIFQLFAFLLAFLWGAGVICSFLEKIGGMK